MTPKFNHQEFNIFLMLYASFTDYEYSEKEEKNIRECCDQETYQKIFKQFNEMSSFQRLQTIIDHKETHYPTKEKKEAVLDTLKKQFDVDGDFSRPEQTTLLFLDKLL